MVFRSLMIVLPAVLAAVASVESCFSQTLSLKRYSVKDGLIANDVEAISQDARGYLWFGTTDGISIFDGKSFANVTTLDGLPHNFIRQMVPDYRNPDAMWVVAGGFVCYVDGGIIRQYSLPVEIVHTAYLDSAGVLWCGTNAGVFTITGDSISRFHPEIMPRDIFGIAEAGNGFLWIATDTSLIRSARTSGQAAAVSVDTVLPPWKHSDAIGKPRGTFRSMLTDPSGSVWATNSATYLFHIVGSRVVSIRPGFVNTFLYNISDNILSSYGYDGISEMGTDDPLVTPILTYSTANGLPENTIRSAFIDREGNTWIGGRDYGLVKLSAGSMASFPIGDVQSSHNHEFAVSDRNNHLWVISNDTLVEFWRDRHAKWHHAQHTFNRPSSLLYRSGLSTTYYTGVSTDTGGRLWLASVKGPPLLEGFQIIPDTSFLGDHPSKLRLSKRVRCDDVFRGFPVSSFLVARDGTLWISVWYKGLIHANPDNPSSQYRLFGDAEGVPTNYIRALYEDRGGNVWGASYSEGVVRISRDGQVHRFTAASGLPSDNALCFAEDQNGAVLIGTLGGGMAVVRGNAVDAISVKNGLPSTIVNCIVTDHAHRLWLGTNSGMVYEDRQGMKTFVRNQEFLGMGVLAAGTTQDSLLWFVTHNNLWIYKELKHRRATMPPPVYVTDFLVNGVRAAMRPVMDFGYDENRVEIRFIGISFRDETAIRYLYRLADLENDWQGPTYNTSVTYGHLNPGTYTFEVRAVNVDGTVSAIPASRTFSISGPFWYSEYFTGGVIVLLISGIVFVYRNKAERLKRRQRETESFARALIQSHEVERKRVAGELHDDLGQDLMVIINRAQMGMKSGSIDGAREQLSEIVKASTRSIENVREIAFNLSPYHIEQLGLTESLRTMVEKVFTIPGMKVSSHIDSVDSLLPKDKEICVYRIVQECVNNVCKHSSASEAIIDVTVKDGRIEIAVRDDGKGFDVLPPVVKMTAKGGFGLPGMRERVRILGGTLNIQSSLGMGTTVTVTIPLESAP